MDMPLTIIVKRTKEKIIDACNESNLSPVLLDLILQGIYNEVHGLAEKQTLEDEKKYLKTIEEMEIAKSNDMNGEESNKAEIAK